MKTFFILLALVLSPSFSSATDQIQIIDSTKVNLSSINKLSASFPKAEHPIPIGTITAWYYDFDPPDNNCASSKTGGNGNQGKCIWLECNGQSFSPDVYPEFSALNMAIPDYRGKFLTHSSKDYKPSVSITIEHVLLTEFAVPKDIHNSPYMNGLVNLNTNNKPTYMYNWTGYNEYALTYDEQTKVCVRDEKKRCLKDEKGNTIYTKFYYPDGYENMVKTEEHEATILYSETASLRYFIRVSHPEPEK